MRKLLMAALLAGTTFAASGAQAAAFNGYYAGLSAGFEDISGGNEAGSGVSYGIFAGVNNKLNETFVVGFEGAVDLSTAREDSAGTEVRALHSFDIAARAGYLITPDSLVYVRGGYQNARFRAVSALSAPSASVDAITVGVGYEQVVAQNITGRLSYDYADGKFDYERHRLRAGVALHF